MSAPLPSTSIPSAGSFNVAAVADPRAPSSSRPAWSSNCARRWRATASLVASPTRLNRSRRGRDVLWPTCVERRLRGGRSPGRAPHAARLRGGDGPVVVPSGSCATMMGHHWPQLFAGTKDEARPGTWRRASSSSRSTSTGRMPNVPLARSEGSVTESVVAVHDSCHGLRELAVKEQPRRLLAEAGITVTETAGAERCCGFGGTFCVKMPAVSVAMADDKLDEWSEAGVTTVVGGDLSCLVHLEGRARRRGLPQDFRHLAEMLRP